VAFNLLELVKAGLPPSFADMAGGLLGETGVATGAALTAIIPTLIAAIARKGASDSGAHSIMAMLTNSSVDPAKLSNLGAIFGNGGAQANSMISAGTSIASSLFGDRLAPLAAELGALSGLAKPQSATNVIGLAAPVVLAFVKRDLASGNLSTSSLSALLGSQGQFLQGTLDGRLTGVLGFTEPSAMLASLGSKAPGPLQRGDDRPASAAASASGATGSAAMALFRRWWPWLVAVLVVLFVAARFVTSRAAEGLPAPSPAPRPAASALPPAALPAPAKGNGSSE
jgi:hypothetical protein